MQLVAQAECSSNQIAFHVTRDGGQGPTAKLLLGAARMRKLHRVALSRPARLPGCIHCRYNDDVYMYRHVILPPEIAQMLPRNRLLSEASLLAWVLQHGWCMPVVGAGCTHAGMICSTLLGCKQAACLQLSSVLLRECTLLARQPTPQLNRARRRSGARWACSRAGAGCTTASTGKHVCPLCHTRGFAACLGQLEPRTAALRVSQQLGARPAVSWCMPCQPAQELPLA